MDYGLLRAEAERKSGAIVPPDQRNPDEFYLFPGNASRLIQKRKYKVHPAPADASRKNEGTQMSWSDFGPEQNVSTERLLSTPFLSEKSSTSKTEEPPKDEEMNRRI